MLWQGITYDTGGADIKAGGIMAGMHRDKCGSAAVAGFFQVLIAFAPAFFFTDENMSLISMCVCVYTFFFLDLSQAEAQTPEGCGCNGNGAKQCRIW